MRAHSTVNFFINNTLSNTTIMFETLEHNCTLNKRKHQINNYVSQLSDYDICELFYVVIINNFNNKILASLLVKYESKPTCH